MKIKGDSDRDLPTALIMAAMVDAAGGKIVVGPEHLQRANQGSLTRWEDPITGMVIYSRSGV